MESCKVSEEKLRSETAKLRDGIRLLEREHTLVSTALRSDLEKQLPLRGQRSGKKSTRGRQRAAEAAKEASLQQEQLKQEAEEARQGLIRGSSSAPGQIGGFGVLSDCDALS